MPDATSKQLAANGTGGDAWRRNGRMRPAVAAPASPLATETTMESAATAVESAATETSSAMEPTAAGEAAAV